MTFFANPIQIGKLKLKNRVYLAPLAGVSDVPFRRVCQELGAGLTYVEMLSATAILYGNKKTFAMMARHASESILGVQVTGPDAVQTAKAIEILDREGFETIDINMGCPVKKVVNSGCGSAILKDLDRYKETIKVSRQSTLKPLSIKIRLGYTRDEVNVKETAGAFGASELDQITIHGRTRSESYAIPVDIEGIKLGVELIPSTKVKVGNGDVFTYKDALRMHSLAGCDAVMVSRGALGNPWIFKEILVGESVHPTLEEWRHYVLKHLDYQVQFFGDTPLAAILMRKHLLWYTKGFPGAKQAREKFNRVESVDQIREVLEGFCHTLSKDQTRFSDEKASEKGELLASYDPKFDMDRELDRGVGHL